MYRKLFRPRNKNDLYIYHDFVIVGYDYFIDLLNKQSVDEDEIKDLQAELEYYKVKYYEMKMKARG